MRKALNTAHVALCTWSLWAFSLGLLVQPLRLPAQNASVNAILKQRIIFTVRPLDPNKQPADLEPGDSLRFTYKIYMDTEAPTIMSNVRIELSVRDFSQTFALPSLVPTSFTPLTSYRIKPDGTRLPTDYNPFLDNQNRAIYSLGDLKLDSLQIGDALVVTSDTLGFEFAYQVNQAPRGALCIRLFAGLQDEFIFTNRLGLEQRISGPGSVTEIDTESEIAWQFEIETASEARPHVVRRRITLGDSVHSTTVDTLRLYITYRNTGNISDLGIFRVALPFTGSRIDWEITAAELPPGVGVEIDKAINARHHIILTDSVIVPNESAPRIIALEIAYTVHTLRDRNPRIDVELVALCDESAQNGEIFGIPIHFIADNLIGVRKIADQERIAPGDTITYTLSIFRRIPGVRLDSVRITDVLPRDAVASVLYGGTRPQLLDATPPVISWLLLDFTEDVIIFSYRVVVRPDYHFGVGFDPVTSCQIAFFRNVVNITAVQDTAEGEIPEIDLSDNTAEDFVVVDVLGDVLQLSVSTLRSRPGSLLRAFAADDELALPGDTLHFTYVVQNVNSFAPVDSFGLIIKLPDPDIFELKPPIATGPGTSAFLDTLNNWIDVAVSAGLQPGQSDTVDFSLLVRNTVSACELSIHPVQALLRWRQGYGDCNPASDSTLTNIRLQDTRTLLDLDIAAPDSVYPGEEAEIAITARSRGLVPSQNVEITYTLAPGMSFIGSTPPITDRRGETLLWLFDRLDSTQAETIRLRVRFEPAADCGERSFVTMGTIGSDPAPCAPPEDAGKVIIMRDASELLAIQLNAIPEPEIIELDPAAPERVSYRLRVRNRGTATLHRVVVHVELPAANRFLVDSLSAGGILAGDSLVWRLEQMVAGDDTLLRFSGMLVPGLYCTPGELVVSADVRSDSLGCPARAVQIRHVIRATPADQQRRVTAQITLQESRSDGVLEPNEPATICLVLRSDTTIASISLRNAQTGTPEFLALFGTEQRPLAFTARRLPQPLVPGDSAVFCATLQAPGALEVDSLVIIGIVETDVHCGQAVRAAFAARGAAILNIACALTDSSGDGLVQENAELVSVLITLANASPRFAAERITLHLQLPPQLGQEPVIVMPPYSNADPTDIVQRVGHLAAGADTSWLVEFRYPDFTLQHQELSIEAFFSQELFAADGSLTSVSSERTRCSIQLAHECYARPRTFIPAVHPAGVRFKPDEALRVQIFDAEGNQVWEGDTSLAWHGTRNNGRAVPPGTYVWVIEGQCKGIVLVLR